MPLAFVSDFSRPETLPLLWLVPACVECNALAGSNVFWTFGEKSEFVRARIEARYRKVLAMPEWSDAELAELSGVTRQDVAGAVRLRRKVLRRLAWESVLVDEA